MLMVLVYASIAASGQVVEAPRAVSLLSFAAVTQAPDTRKAVHGFCATLGTSTAFSIVPKLLDSYSALIEGMADGAIDLAWAPPLVAVELEKRSLATPLVAISRSTRQGYHSALFALTSGRFQSPEKLRGATAAWVSRESASGYFVPRWHLRSVGLRLEKCFGAEIFCNSHQAVVEAVVEGKADVGATHVGLEPETGQLARAPWLSLGVDAASIRVLLLVGPIPGDVISASQRVPVWTRRRLTAALLAMHATSGAETLFDATRFEPVSDGHLWLLKRLYGFSEGTFEPPGQR